MKRLGAVSATLIDLVFDEPSIGDGSQTLFPITDGRVPAWRTHGVEVADDMMIPERVVRECPGE